MIFLYYTGADQFNVPQNDPLKSLGGNISSSLIGNDVINNLFSDVSNFTTQKNTSDTKCISIKNGGSAKIIGLKFYFNLPADSIFTYEVAFVNSTNDKCGNPYFEKLNNSEAVPYYATFVNALGQSNEVTIGDLDAGKYLGMFIRRKLKAPNTGQDSCVAVDPLNNNLPVVEKLEFNFNWS